MTSSEEKAMLPMAKHLDIGAKVKEESSSASYRTDTTSCYRDTSKKPPLPAPPVPLPAMINGKQGTAYDRLPAPMQTPTMQPLASTSFRTGSISGRRCAIGQSDEEEEDEGGGGGGSSDRLRNDLLDEICSDMGIHDCMDLDIIYDYPLGSTAVPPYEERPLYAPMRQVDSSAAASSRLLLQQQQRGHVLGATARTPQSAGVQYRTVSAPGLAAATGGVSVKREACEAAPGRSCGAETEQSLMSVGRGASHSTDDAKVLAAANGGECGGVKSATEATSDERVCPPGRSGDDALSAAGFDMRTPEHIAMTTEGSGHGALGEGDGTSYARRRLKDEAGPRESSGMSPDLLADLMQSGATDDGKFAAPPQHSAKMLVRQRSDCSPYQVPPKHSSGSIYPPQTPSPSVSGGSVASPGIASRRHVSDAESCWNGGMPFAPLQQPATVASGGLQWSDCGVGGRWTAYGYGGGEAFSSASSSQSFHEYPEDFCMEDLEAQDSTINFSEKPQQPNYYQVPEMSAAAASLAANSQLNISFNMSLTSSQPLQQASMLQQQQHMAAPPLHHLQQPLRPLPQQYGRQPSASGSYHAGVQDGGTFVAGQLVGHSQQQLHFNGTCNNPFGLSTAATHHHSAQPTSMAGAGAYRSPSHAGMNGGGSGTGLLATASPTGSMVGASPASKSSTAAYRTTQNFMQHLIMDGSNNAFKSHPLYPLLRDLILADMNFDDPSFPHQLMRDLPADFNKLLKNYRKNSSRRPPGNYQALNSVESVVMDALKVAHQSLIDKIRKRSVAATVADSLRPNLPSIPTSQRQKTQSCNEKQTDAASPLQDLATLSSASSIAQTPIGPQDSADDISKNLNIPQKQDLDQASVANSYLSECAGGGCQSGSGGVGAGAVVLMQSPNYRQPLTVDTSCGFGTAIPPPSQQQPSVPNGYMVNRQLPVAHNSINRLHARPQQPLQAPSYEVLTPSSCPSSYLGGDVRESGSGGRRESLCYNYGNSTNSLPSYTAIRAPPQQPQYYPQAAAPPASLQYDSGQCTQMYPSVYSHMQNGGQMSDRHHDINMYINNNMEGGQFVKTVMEQGKVGSGSYLGGPQCDYSRGGNMGSSGGRLGNAGDMSSNGMNMQPSCQGPVGSSNANGHLGQLPMGKMVVGLQQQTSAAAAAAAEGTRKHQSLPKEAVSVMLSWLKDHQDKPYPNDDEKGALIKQTNLSITQINYWFTNARRRLLPKWRGEDM